LHMLLSRGSEHCIWHQNTQLGIFPIGAYIIIDTEAVPIKGDVIATEDMTFERYHGLRLASEPVNILGVVRGLAITDIQAYVEPLRKVAVG
jgi:hypothetical protein